MISYLRGLTPYQRVRFATVGIMALAAAVSYTHQRELLAVWGVDGFAQYAVPLTVDLLAIICNIALHTPNVARRGFWVSLLVLAVAVAASGTANFIAGGTLGAKCANLWTVVAYLLAEFVAVSVKASVRAKDPVRVAAGRKSAATKAKAKTSTLTRKSRAPKVPATAAEANVMLAAAGTAPVSPAPAER